MKIANAPGLLGLVTILSAISIGSLRATESAAKQGTEKKPNIIFILADDLGFNQIGAYGDTPIKTPRLDRLARSGIRFTQAYSGNTVCSPSRVSLFTGRDGRLMENNSNTVQLAAMDVTIAHVLKHAGYDTALFGKYSIGSQMGVTDPLAMGFDTWYGMYSILEGHRQYPHILWRDGKKIRLAANEGDKKGAYAQELFANEAIEYIKQDRKNPFFVLLAFSSPHAELAAPLKYVRPYENAFAEERYSGMASGTPSDKYAWYYPEPVEKPNATLAGMVTALDDYVGKIVDTLEERGIADNTLIFFTSDNGPHDEGGADPAFFKAAAPYKGMKRDLYDGGIHVPMIVHWPDSIKSGRVDETPWAFADVLPTLAEIANVPMRSVPRLKTNGVSIANRLKDQPEPLAERTLYWEFGKQVGDPNSGVVGEVFQAARRGPWKAVRNGIDAPVELYHIKKDPGESKELREEHDKVYQEFEALFKKHSDQSTSDSANKSNPGGNLKAAGSLIRPPSGRLALVIDGNSPDPDDIGATAVTFGLLKAGGVADRLVHLSHSCDLKPVDRISVEDELRRQDVLQQLCRDGVSRFGPFKNLKAIFNCRTQQEAAVVDLKKAIDSSTKQDPLWIIEAGEPDVIGFALRLANPEKLKHVHVVSHHPANDDSGDFFTWQQILDFGVVEHQIGDQNVGLQTLVSKWDWAKAHQDSRMNWIWRQLKYAEQDGVVKFQSNKFDCSDAGMILWWMTGASKGGNATATPTDVAEILKLLK